MSELYHAAEGGDLERVHVLVVEQEADKDKVDIWGRTPLYIASRNGHLEVVRYLVEQGADMDKADCIVLTPLIVATFCGHLEVVRYLLEQGADRDKADTQGTTSLHYAAEQGHLKIAKLLMAYGADLNARTKDGQLPIDMGRHNNKEIKQAIRDEPERRWDQQPRKRCIEQDQHPTSAASASAQQEDDDEQIIKLPAEGEAEEGKMADEDQDSEPSSDEDGN